MWWARRGGTGQVLVAWRELGGWPGAFAEGRREGEETTRVSSGAEACGGSGSNPGRAACMCVVGERHLNIVGMKDKFKTHQAQLRQDDNVMNMNHSF